MCQFQINFFLLVLNMFLKTIYTHTPLYESTNKWTQKYPHCKYEEFVDFFILKYPNYITHLLIFHNEEFVDFFFLKYPYYKYVGFIDFFYLKYPYYITHFLLFHYNNHKNFTLKTIINSPFYYLSVITDKIKFTILIMHFRDLHFPF